MWCNALISDDELLTFLSSDIMENRVKLDAILAIIRYAMGDPKTAKVLIDT